MSRIPARRARGAFAVAALVACLLVSVARAQSGTAARERFELPRIATPEPAPAPGCAAARELAETLLPDVESDVPADMQAALRGIAADLEPDQSPAEGWDYAASLASLAGDVGAALWAELLALQLEWRPEFATAAGVYLHLVGPTEDALVFLDCAYGDGFRSPFLMEALANIHQRAGETDEARRYVREALAAAPEDPILQTTSSLIETGQPPPPPPPGADPLDRALAELQQHIETVLAALRQTIELQNRVDAAGGDASRAQEKLRFVDDIRASYAATVDSIRSMIAQTRRASPELQPLYRNGVLHSLITMYLSTTNNMFTWCDQVYNPWSGSSTLDMSFWAEVLGLQPVQFTRMLVELRDFEYEGCRAGVVGGWLDDFGGAPFASFSCALSDWRYDASGRCLGSGTPAAQEACRLEVDRQFCAAQRQLLRDYIDVSESWFQRGARGFDRAEARRIAAAGLVVDDAFRYASTWAHEMQFPPGDALGAEMLRSLQQQYDELVDQATGTGDANDGPGHMVKHEAETFRIQKENSEVTHANLSAGIESTCQPVDLRVFEALAREHAEAVRAMLLDRLLHDVDAEWDPDASCTFSAGKYFRASIDIDGKTSVGGSWKSLEKALPEALGHGDAKVDVGRRFKVDFQGGEFVGASAGLDGSAKYPPFTGKGTATVGVAWDGKKQVWTYPVEFSGTLGFGYKTKTKDGQDGFGFECYPGKARIKFDARVVAKDAMAYLAAQRAR